MICLHLVVIALFVVEWYVNFKLMSPTIIFFVYLRRGNIFVKHQIWPFCEEQLKCISNLHK